MAVKTLAESCEIKSTTNKLFADTDFSGVNDDEFYDE